VATKKAAAKKAAKKSAKKAGTRSSARSTDDALELLVADHETVDKLFERFAGLGDGAKKTKQQVADRIIRELAVHAVVEEQVLYPVIRECSEELEAHVLESLEEHHVGKVLLAELQNMDPDHERFDAKVKVLSEIIRHHVKEEEKDIFPEVRKKLDDEVLADMGKAIKKAKKAAPTRAHPGAPDEPPGNVVAGAVASIVDRVRDLGKGMAEDAGKAARQAKSG
jgi:hemerythrin superfamily protein